MKKLILIFFVTNLLTLNAQKKLKATDTINLITITSDEVKNNYKRGFDTDVLILNDGSVIEKGSNLIIGEPSNIQKVSGQYIDYTYLMIGRYSGMTVVSEVYLSNNWSQTEIVVERIRIYRNGKNIIPVVDFTAKNESSIGMGKFGCIINLSEALSKGEVINPNRPMNRQEAIAKLKEAKDLVDIGMMSSEDFEKLKAELQPIIMNK